MEIHATLPPTPLFDVEIVEDRSPPSRGFLRYVTRLMRLVDPTGKRGTPFIYDEVDRAALDAVVIVPHFTREDSPNGPVRYVVLRSAVRPPVVLRARERSLLSEPPNRGMWEFPAGLIEPEEKGKEGVQRAAARELEEETGFSVELAALKSLGPSTFPAPGICGERHFYFHVEVKLTEQGLPSLDGSPLEEAGEIIALPLKSALQAARAGKIEDAKTELALRRLIELDWSNE